ncbi:MAG TPA: isoprenylcysteine carboxylmethyltransferase family protein [Anaeromyxobacteraceae bacterium]|nr:isoprenylcysteine carboxylmethyltransferase family protein [Anaeromyxobacteraceae bacterium]
MVTLPSYLALVGLFGLERVAELLLSRRNARRATAAGAVEVGRGHYAVMVPFHAAFLGACVAEAVAFPEPPPRAAAVAAALAVAAQALRWWSVSALGPRWNTRILVVPGDVPVRRGPYRFLRHPNYVAVAVELAALPLAWGSWRTALAFSIGNALLLAVRVPAEERALGERYAAVFSGTPRFVPRGRASPPPGVAR